MGRTPKRAKNGNTDDPGRTEELAPAVSESTPDIDDGSISDGGGDDSGDAIEPASIPDNGDAGTRRRKPRSDRGTRRGGRTSRRTQGEDAKDLTAILYSLHVMAAALTKVEELALTEQEAEQLAVAIARVNEVYGNVVLPEKVVVWINLAMAMGTVYGPRFIAYNIRKKKEPKTIDGEIVH